MSSDEARAGARQRTFLGARIVFQDYSGFLACTIRNRSENGARLEVASTQAVPKRFYLVIPKDRLAYEAESVWRQGGQVGVRLLNTVDLSSKNNSSVAKLLAIMDK